MHILIGFGITVGLIAFAFGPEAAKACIRFVALAIIIFLTWFIYDAIRDDTPKSVSTCGDCVNSPPWLAKSAVAKDTYFPPEPRCGVACEVDYDSIPKSCWDWMKNGAAQPEKCRRELNK